MGEFADAYDGTTLWSQDISGGVHARDAAFPRALAITDAYLARRGYLRSIPGAALECRGTLADRARTLIVVRATPPNGIPADLGIDRATHTVVRVAERLPITTQITRFGDYRRVDGLLVPFAIESASLLEPDDGYVFSVDGYRVASAAAGALFAEPHARNPGFVRGGGSSASVPITLEADQLLVWASIDGHSPMPFILDTGGHAILTGLAAKTLGLSASGAGVTGGSGAGTTPLQFTRVKSIRIGAAELDDQPMLVVAYPYSFYERGTKTPLAGILGLEFFERFATRVDYAGRRVTFTPLARFAYRGNASAVRMRFQEDMPMVDAAADGRRGTFGIDTGNSGSLILFGDFLEKNGFFERYPAGDLILGHGTGGTNTGHREILQSFTIGARTLRGVPSYFSRMTSGSFASWTEAGNAGYDVLSRFIPTFDYARHALYLEASPHAPRLGVNRSGLGVSKNGPDAFDVDLVRPRSPAQSLGIRAGDRIVAVNGHPAHELSRADFVALAEQPPGSALQLQIARAGAAPRNLTLVLR